MEISGITASELIALLEQATGNVFLVMRDGSCFNLNSKLAQLYCIRMLLNHAKGGRISPHLKFEKPEDRALFQSYLYNHYTKFAS